jgi:hypothetical protein
MKVQMFLVAGPGFPAEIQANIESIRVHHLLQCACGSFHPVHEATLLIGGQFVQTRYVAPWKNEQMPVVVREPVHHRHYEVATVKDKTFLV